MYTQVCTSGIVGVCACDVQSQPPCGRRVNKSYAKRKQRNMLETGSKTPERCYFTRLAIWALPAAEHQTVSKTRDSKTWTQVTHSWYSIAVRLFTRQPERGFLPTGSIKSCTEYIDNVMVDPDSHDLLLTSADKIVGCENTCSWWELFMVPVTRTISGIGDATEVILNVRFTVGCH